MLSAAYAQLGQLDPARKALQELLRMRPNIAETVRDDLEQWFDPEYVTHLTAGLRKAGLQLREQQK